MSGFPVCPNSFLQLLGEREGSCAASGLQFHFINIQFVTLAQCMSPQILQGFHSLGRRVVTVSLAVTCPRASSSAHTNKPTPRPCPAPPTSAPAPSPSCSLFLSPRGTSKRPLSRVCSWIPAEGTQAEEGVGKRTNTKKNH